MTIKGLIMKSTNIRSKKEAFSHDVDHIPGRSGINLPAQDSRDLLNKSRTSYGSKRQWDQDVARVNAELLDDQAEFTTDANGFVEVLINGVAFARWSRRNGNGDIDIKAARAQSDGGSFSEATKSPRSPRIGTMAWELKQQRERLARDPEEIKRIEKIGNNNHYTIGYHGNIAKITHKEGMTESVLTEALNELSTAPDRVTNYNPLFAPNRAMASNKSGKYCLTRDNPPVRGKGFMCFGGEKDAIAAWKRLTNNVGVKIVRESAVADDGTPLKEGEVLLVNTSMLSEAVGDRYADQLADRLPPGLVDEDAIADRAFEIAEREFGSKQARRMFAYDEDFLSDLVSSYFAREHAGEVQEAASTVKSAVPRKPRNYVAKNIPVTGAGKHTDKKRAAKQGDVKHKGKLD